MRKKENLTILQKAQKEGFLYECDEDLKTKRTFVYQFLFTEGNLKMLRFISSILKKEPEWEDFTDENLKLLHDAILKEYTPCTGYNYICYIRSILKSNNLLVPSDNIEKILTLPQNAKKCQKEKDFFLTPMELLKIDRYNSEDEIEMYTKRIFLLMCYTGAKLEAAQSITTDNIYGESLIYDKDEDEGICIPLSDNARKYIVQPSKLIQYTYANMRTALKNIASKCIDEDKANAITFRTAIKTFCTRLYLSGVDIEDICIITGVCRKQMRKLIVGYHSKRRKKQFIEKTLKNL